jgi:NDP-sugar pyrophosphorylase family protein
VPDLSGTTAVLLAGGLGTRLRAAVADRPKVLAPVHGRPFIAYLLDQLRDAGVREVVISTGYGADQVEQALGSTHGPIRVGYAREKAPLGTGGAVRLAAARVESDPVLVMNGDTLCRADLGQFLDWHAARAAEGSLLLARVDDAARYGLVSTGPAGEVVAFTEKSASAGAGWINAGVYLLRRRVIDSIGPEGPASLERDVFPAWIGRGLYGCPTGGPFLDIGTPESYAAAAAFLAGP